MSESKTLRVLMTDYAWPDLAIEREVLGRPAELYLPRATDEESLVAAAATADAIMNNWAPVTAAVIDAAPRCRIIARMGIGLDSIDIGRATERGILVTNVPDYCLTEVAEHTLALLLACGGKIGHYHLETKAGRYALQSGPTLRRIAGQTLGIVGLGAIGSRVAEKAAAWGLKVLATTQPPNRSARREPGPARRAFPRATMFRCTFR